MPLCETIITKYAQTGSIIYTDKWRGYFNMQRNCNFTHKTVNHSIVFVDPITLAHANTIEGNWSILKIQVPYKCKTKRSIWLWLMLFMLKRNEHDYLCELIKLII